MAPRIVLVLGVIVVVAPVAPTASGGATLARTLPFRTVVRTSHAEYGEYGPPRVVVAMTRQQLLSRVGPLAAADQPRVARVNLRRYGVVGVFGGRTESCCARLVVRRLRLIGRQLCVTAASIPPADGGPPSEGYHVVTIRRTLLTPTPRRWRLLNLDGTSIRASRGARPCR
jgi:hypothetical protein